MVVEDPSTTFRNNNDNKQCEVVLPLESWEECHPNKCLEEDMLIEIKCRHLHHHNITVTITVIIL